MKKAPKLVWKESKPPVDPPFYTALVGERIPIGSCCFALTGGGYNARVCLPQATILRGASAARYSDLDLAKFAVELAWEDWYKRVHQPPAKAPRRGEKTALANTTRGQTR
jgi:hypothetical protein